MSFSSGLPLKTRFASPLRAARAAPLEEDDIQALLKENAAPAVQVFEEGSDERAGSETVVGEGLQKSCRAGKQT